MKSAAFNRSLIVSAIAIAIFGMAGCQQKPMWVQQTPQQQAAAQQQAKQAIENNPNLSPQMKQRLMSSGFGPASPAAQAQMQAQAQGH